MTKPRFLYIVLPIVVLIIAALACDYQIVQKVADGQTPQPPTQAPPEPTQEIVQPPTSLPEPTQVVPPEVVPTEPVPTEVVTHVMLPRSPTSVSSWITDSSADSPYDRSTAADQFGINIYERPFTRQDMEYQDFLDINYAELNVRSPWVYVTIFLEGEPPLGSPSYGVEIDTDRDGRGDWLVTGMVPPSDQWTADRVRIHQDTNNDVGGPTPLVSDHPAAGRDGHDSLVFDQGHGPDPDAAWIRRDPEDPKRVQLAFKYNVIGNADEFLWGVLSFDGPKRPEWYDFNDHFTLEEAGSPFDESPYYPLKDLDLIDSTCRGYYGFDPTGAEPGLCGLPVAATPEPDQPGTGWCVRALLSGCASPCQPTCPPRSSCLPCTLAGVSDADLKCGFTEIDEANILEKLADLPITAWQYKHGDRNAWHMGPTAQDFYEAFGLGPDDRSINSIDGDGVAFAAIQGLYQLAQDKQAQIELLEGRMAALEDEILAERFYWALIALAMVVLAAVLTSVLTLRLQRRSAQDRPDLDQP